MASIDDFMKTSSEKDQFLADLSRRLEVGEITEEQFSELSAAFDVLGEQAIQLLDNGQQFDPTDDINDTLDESIASVVQEKLQPNAFVGNVQGISDNDLTFEVGNTQNDPEVLQQLQTEKLTRDRLREGSIGEVSSDPEFWRRMGNTAIKGPSTAINGIVNGLPAIVNLGLGNEEASQAGFQEFMRVNQNLNDFFNVSDPIRPSESFAESLTGAAVPGGILAKSGGIATDFLMDQTVREMTDRVGEQYQTIFDKANITDNNQEPLLGPISALLATMVGGSVGIATVKKLSQRAMNTAPNTRQIQDIDPSGPENLSTIEKAADFTKATQVDEQSALVDLARRSGMPDLDDITNMINSDTLMSAQTRIQEAINTGILSSNGRTFNPSVSPRDLYNGYKALEAPIRDAAAKYINMLDMMDDVRIAMAQNSPGNHQQVLARLQQQTSALVNQFPIVKQLSSDFNSITASIREFLDGNMISNQFRRQLDTDRSNYVPLRINDVDESAPLLQRLSQSRVDRALQTRQQFDDAFLLNRQSSGNYDLARRADPFNMMIEYVESALTAGMRNNVQRSYVDALMSSPNGQGTIRRATPDEFGKFPDREISIRRNGEKEIYLTSRLQAQLLRFDPSFMQMPAFFLPKRLAEQTSVGPASVVFAPVTAIRDTIGGAVLRPEGVKTGTPLQVAAAIPEQLWAKAQGAFASSMEQSLLRNSTLFPEWMLSATQQRAIADRVGNSYTNTMYHMANLEGGFDASLMRNRIKLGQGMLQEARRTLTEGHNRNPVFNNLVTRVPINVVQNGIRGFNALFDAIQDAPRFAAFKQTVKDGVDPNQAAAGARQITGDTTRGGRAFDAAGNRLTSDATDQGLLNAVNPTLASAGNFAREATPFFNPMVQGTRRLLNSFADDPVGTNLRAFQYVGVPAIAAYGWNEMLGQEYNDYSQLRRSSRDVAMGLYIGVPGLPPEQGIEIPLPHELLFYNSPFTRSMYSLSRGDGGAEVSAAMSNLSSTILKNSVDVGFPTTLALAANATGVNAPDSLLDPTDGVFMIKEDNTGFLSQNIETMIKTLFTSVGDTALRAAYSVANAGDDRSFEDFYGEVYERTLRRVPVAGNLSGGKTANVGYSVPAAYRRERLEAVEEFRTYWDEFYNPKRISAAGLDRLGSAPSGFMKELSNSRAAEEDGRQSIFDGDRDLPYREIGPDQMIEPTNPLIAEFGTVLADALQKNNYGMSAASQRINLYGRVNRQLKSYTVGDQESIAEWQQKLEDISTLTGDDLKLAELINEGEYDLTSITDRNRLVNEIEAERSYLIQTQLDFMDEVEATFNSYLREQGRIPSGERFSLTKDLKPFGENNFGEKTINSPQSLFNPANPIQN